MIACGGYDGSLTLFHLSQRAPIITFSAHADPVVSVDFATPCEIATASFDGLVRLWDCSKRSNCLYTLGNGIGDPIPMYVSSVSAIY